MILFLCLEKQKTFPGTGGRISREVLCVDPRHHLWHPHAAPTVGFSGEWLQAWIGIFDPGPWTGRRGTGAFCSQTIRRQPLSLSL